MCFIPHEYFDDSIYVIKKKTKIVALLKWLNYWTFMFKT